MKYLEENFISIVMIVQDEEKSIEGKLHQLNMVMSDKFKNYEIVVVDNASKDDTRNILRRCSDKITVIELPRRHDVEMALQAGIDIAIGDYIVEVPSVDAVGDWNVVTGLYDKSQEGYDFVFCVPRDNAFSSKVFYYLMNKAMQESGHTCSSSVATLSSRRGQNKVESIGNKIVNRNVAYVMCGLAYSSIEGPQSYRNNRSFKHNVKLFTDTLIYYTDYAIKGMISLSILFLLVSMGCGIYSVLAKLFIDTAYGWASTMLVICLGFSGMFIFLAVISKYLDHILKNTLRTKNYIYRDVIKK